MIKFVKDSFTKVELEELKKGFQQDEAYEGIGGFINVEEDWEVLKEANGLELASDIRDSDAGGVINVPGKMTTEEAYVALLWGFCQEEIALINWFIDESYENVKSDMVVKAVDRVKQTIKNHYDHC